MYRRILVPLDGSELAEQVVPYARLLGKALNARMELLRVNEALRPQVAGVLQEPYRLDLVARWRAESLKYLEGVALPLREDGLQVKVTVEEDSPAARIVKEAEADPATLVAMATHGRAGIARWLLGSVTTRVIQITSNPVLLVRAREPQERLIMARLETLLVPLDESSLAEQVLPHVIALARAVNLGVVLVTVTPYPEEYYRYMEYRPPSLEEAAREVDEQAMGYLRRVSQTLRDQGVAAVQERLLHGLPAAAIVDLAHQTPHSLVAMTTHGRSGIGRFLLGSVADRVVRHSGVPVLLVRATDDSSPDALI